jgi:cation diffusion facilitator family transporter
VLWIVLGLNVGVATVKLGVGTAIGSLALFADGVHATLDGSANIVGLVGVFLAARPPDAGHPYGHRRFEAIAALLIGLLIGAGMIEVVSGIVEGFSGSRPPPDVSWSSTAAVAATVVVNLFITRYEARRGRELKSALLSADAAHTAADTLGALSVLASFGAVALGVRWADLAAAIVVSVLIARTAWRVMSTNLGVLADRAQLDPHLVRSIALAVDGVEGAHRIRSRGMPGHVQLDLHIHVDPQMPVDEAHEITHRVADAIKRELPDVADVVIHTEPADGREQDLASVAPL